MEKIITLLLLVGILFLGCNDILECKCEDIIIEQSTKDLEQKSSDIEYKVCPNGQVMVCE